MLLVAILFECIFPLYQVSWESYGAISEIRILLWLMVCFSFSRRKSIYVRGLILFLCFWQVATAFIYCLHALGIDSPINVIHAISVAAVITFLWFIFRTHERPAGSIHVCDIDKTKNYILIKKPCPSYFKDVILSFLGRPAGSIAIYFDGDLYGFKKGSQYYQKNNGSSLRKSNRYAIEIEIKDKIEAKKIIESLVGVKYHQFRCNCVNILSGLFDHIGLNLNPLQRTIPGLFVAQLAKVCHGRK